MIKKEITLVDIYIKQLVEFNDYIIGKRFRTDVESRRKLLFNIDRLFINILKLKQADINTLLDYFTTLINDHAEFYTINRIMEPITTLDKKKIPKDANIERVKVFICFFIDLSQHRNSLERYLSGRDLPYFFKHWDIPQRESLLHYFCYLKL